MRTGLFAGFVALGDRAWEDAEIEVSKADLHSLMKVIYD